MANVTASSLSIDDGTITWGDMTIDGILTATGFTIGSAVINETDLEKIDGITNGVSAANKAVVLDGSGNFEFQDSDVLYFGTSGDMRILHDGSDSYIRDTGTGSLIVGSSLFQVMDSSLTDSMIYAVEDGAVTFYYNAVAKLATSSAGATVTGILTTTSGINVSGNAYFNANDMYDVGNSDSQWTSTGLWVYAAAPQSGTYATATIKSTNGANTYSGLVVDTSHATTQSHVRFAINGTLKWQWRTPAHTDTSFRAYSFDTSKDILTMLPSGNIGIGVTDPDHLLEIKNTDGAAMLKLERSSGNTGIAAFTIGGADPGLNLTLTGTSSDFVIVSGGTDALRVNAGGTTIVRGLTSLYSGTFNESAGNSDFRVESEGNNSVPSDISNYALFVDANEDHVGIGQAPETAWHTGYFVLGIGAKKNSISTTVTSNAGDWLSINHNAYVATGGSWAYQDDNSAGASNVYFYEGQIRFRVATAGTAGNPLTWTNALQINETGLVSIGTTSPTSYHANADNLVVYSTGNTGITLNSGTSNIGSFYFADGTSGSARYRGFMEYSHTNDSLYFGTAGSTRLLIDSAGKVGIGTSAPSSNLEVAASNAASTLTLSSWDVDTIGNVGTLKFTKSASNTIQTFAATGDGEWLGTIGFYGSDSGSTISARSSFIDVVQSGSAGGSSVASYMSIGTSGTERMRFGSSGNIGIGTTTPTDFKHADADGPTLNISGNMPLILGSDHNTAGRTNTTHKYATIGLAHYTNAEEPTAMLYGSSEQNISHVMLGGGQPWMNAVEQISFYTAGNTTTPTGTLRGLFNDSGNFYIYQHFIMQAGKEIYLDGGSDTYIQESAGNVIQFVAGGADTMYINGGLIKVGDTAYNTTIVNASSIFGSKAPADYMALSATNPSYNWACVGIANTGSQASAANYLVAFYDSDSYIGGIYHAANNVTTYATTSDYRLKENETLITGALDRVKRLKPYRFNFKRFPDELAEGFFAHELDVEVPFAVIGEKDAMQGEDDMEPGEIKPQQVDNAKIIPVLVAAIQELEKRVAELESS